MSPWTDANLNEPVYVPRWIEAEIEFLVDLLDIASL